MGLEGGGCESKSFIVARRGLRVGGQLEIFGEQYREAPWKLLDQVPTLSATELALSTRSSGVGEVCIDDDRGVFKIRELHEQLAFIGTGGPKTEGELAVWLDQRIPHPDIAPGDSTLFLRKMIESLIEQRACSLATLIASWVRLQNVAESKIDSRRLRMMNELFQHLLLGGDEAAAETEPAIAFDCPLNTYPARSLYEGRITFEKHYHDVAGYMSGGEAGCAKIIEGLDEARCRVKSIERQPECSFSLPPSMNNFYPDGVALLREGCELCVEY
ncbi:MAG: hypothetical protein AAGK04_02355 [Planctomycetota bacterium]